MSLMNGRRHRENTRSSPDWDAHVLVWGFWGLMLLSALALVARFSNNVPIGDQWPLVPQLTGAKAVTMGWLWELYNGQHRLVLPKLIMLASVRLTGGNFLPQLYLHVLALGGLAAAMIVTMRNIRGSLAYSDAFFPLVLLNLCQGNAFMNGSMINLLLATFFVGIFLLVIAGSRAPLTARRGMIGGTVLVLLPLCGGSGVVLTPFLASWLVLAAIARWRSPRPNGRRDGLLALSLALLSLAIVACYLIGYESPGQSHPSPRDTLKFGLLTLSLSLGQPVLLWPLSGGIVLGLLLLGATACVANGYRRPRERLRAAGILLFLGGMGTLALLVGRGRSSAGFPYFMSTHYVTMMAPTLCGLYFLGDFYRGAVGRLVQYGLFSMVAMMFYANLETGIGFVSSAHAETDKLLGDVRAGMPPIVIAGRASSNGMIGYKDVDAIDKWLNMLRRAGFGSFRALRTDPSFREVSFDAAPVDAKGMEWKGGVAQGSGRGSYISFPLGGSRLIYAITLHCEFLDLPQVTQGSLSLSWKSTAADDFAPREQSDRVRISKVWKDDEPRRETLTFWINGSVSEFRVSSEFPEHTLKINSITLLVPVE
jgi:hypothetical protein